MGKNWSNLVERVVFFVLSLFCMHIFALGKINGNLFMSLIGVIGFICSIIINNFQIRNNTIELLENYVEKNKAIEEDINKIFNNIVEDCRNRGMDMKSEETLNFIKNKISKELQIPIDDITLSVIEDEENEDEDEEKK